MKWVPGMSTRNEYQVSSWRVNCGQHVMLTTSMIRESQLSRKFGILDFSEPYRPTRPVRKIAMHIVAESVY
jgi:hypothetical protein